MLLLFLQFLSTFYLRSFDRDKAYEAGKESKANLLLEGESLWEHIEVLHEGPRLRDCLRYEEAHVGRHLGWHVHDEAHDREQCIVEAGTLPKRQPDQGILAEWVLAD